jgi:hypothetical protein
VFREVGVKGFMGLLKVGVIGFALIAGGMAAYRYRGKLASNWRNLQGIGGIKGHAGKLSVDRLFGSVAPIKDLVGQFAHLKFAHLR